MFKWIKTRFLKKLFFLKYNNIKINEHVWYNEQNSLALSTYNVQKTKTDNFNSSTVDHTIFLQSIYINDPVFRASKWICTF